MINPFLIKMPSSSQFSLFKSIMAMNYNCNTHQVKERVGAVRLWELPTKAGCFSLLRCSQLPQLQLQSVQFDRSGALGQRLGNPYNPEGWGGPEKCFWLTQCEVQPRFSKSSLDFASCSLGHTAALPSTPWDKLSFFAAQFAYL